jgi:predicted DCC family thiol-disulfide oxidoreductase YuxK
LIADPHPKRHVLLYDADCGFCKWALARVLGVDRRRRLRPVPIQDREAAALLSGMSAERGLASWHLVTPGGEVRSAGAAVAPLARLLPGCGPLAALADAAPDLTGRLYEWVARNRRALGRLVTKGAVRRADRRIAKRSVKAPSRGVRTPGMGMK